MESIVMKNIFLLLLLFSTGFIKAEQLFVDPLKGKDSNPGTKPEPLRTIMEAARRVNAVTEKGPAEIILTEGVHVLTETALFNNNRFSNSGRLTLRAEIMPDDTAWKPQRMPVIITIVPFTVSQFGEEAYGLQVEVSHVTIEGIKFTGSPDYTNISKDVSRRTYPIWRGGNTLDDLVVAQCLFVGDEEVLPLHVGVIANGHGLVLDHCVFYNCKNPVVFWRAEDGISHRNAMRYCLVYGAYFSGIWTVETDGDDFDCQHNVFANCAAGWVRENKSQRKYKLHDCLFAEYKTLAAYGGARQPNPTPTDFLSFTNTRMEGSVKIEKDQTKRNYLQLAEGSDGMEIGAGLFKK